ncbi:HEAT repeat domain-containing protein [Tuwongella immobilis]|uniref:HEAT repeat domain-containing protein n=1 Tax=Tuwongella immobilis TaxID=692036 RepID=A0A6C2YQ57_9BACT|nr:HEAT repeat domain-containing protein [Tuwongella immobilis]VIP03022.1 heat repeat-containing protein : HEAT repeats family protein OS=Lyngbya aestuarii BL J GN=M595_0012 PE=4 SV=1: HEAT_2 [Tuwongella immobilis]VTS03154.1 heat repeat-containing protein : HEAT repeats family protein OS=Lyngbya aestuarii BL J GN=M595_0012 PE=4 SV=1: HEAT_2 [Tuwongella immobilis]
MNWHHCLALVWLALVVPASRGQPADLPPPPKQAPTEAYPDRKLIASLVESLTDADSEVRLHLATALSQCGPEALPPLIEALSDKLPARRGGAAYALGQMGPSAKSAIPNLVANLKDPDVIVRRQTALAISRILTPERRLLNAPNANGMPRPVITPFVPIAPVIPAVPPLRVVPVPASRKPDQTP